MISSSAKASKWRNVLSSNTKRFGKRQASLRFLIAHTRWLSSQPIEDYEEEKVSTPAVLHNSRKLARESLVSKKIEREHFGPGDKQRLQFKSFDSPSHLEYTGNVSIPVTSKLYIYKPEEHPKGVWPIFRLMDEDGNFRNPAFDIDNNDNSVPSSYVDLAQLEGSMHERHDSSALRSLLIKKFPYHEMAFEQSLLLQDTKYAYPDTQSPNTLLRAYRQMVRLREMDQILQNAQRQGRISFYMTCRGEEAIHFGSASAMDAKDVILAQYREAGVLMWRGFTLEQFANQCFSNDADLGKGRQMPVHYGSRALHYQTISSPLGTQIPQAVGVAYQLKLSGKKNTAFCFFGDGCASTTDFHAGMNFAATLKCPVVFFCRNNGYAISTPVMDQYAGDGIVSRGPGYGIASIRVDGNDAFAVHAATRAAREYALEHSAPVLVEAMTYRLGHHSTSDDSSRYRSKNEVDTFETAHDPLRRLHKFLEAHDWLTDDEALAMCDEEKIAVLQAMEKAEKRPKPSIHELFKDVYSEIPPRLREQQRALDAHVARYPTKY